MVSHSRENHRAANEGAIVIHDIRRLYNNISLII